MLSPSNCHPAGPAGPYVAGGPVGPDETLSPFIPDHAGRHVAVGPVGPFGMLSPSDCHPAGPHAAGGPAGPDGTLSPFVSNHAGPAGRHVAIGPVGPFGTLSHLTVTLLARRARVLQRALLALMGHCLRVSLTMLAGMLRLAPVTSGSAILVDPGGSTGTLLPGEGGPKFCPDVLQDDLVLGAAVPLPALQDPRVASSGGGSAGR